MFPSRTIQHVADEGGLSKWHDDRMMKIQVNGEDDHQGLMTTSVCNGVATGSRDGIHTWNGNTSHLWPIRSQDFYLSYINSRCYRCPWSCRSSKARHGRKWGVWGRSTSRVSGHGLLPRRRTSRIPLRHPSSRLHAKHTGISKLIVHFIQLHHGTLVLTAPNPGWPPHPPVTTKRSTLPSLKRKSHQCSTLLKPHTVPQKSICLLPLLLFINN